jgi:ubiquinone/menaquinone biosynthesis C-methylase UbiE
LRTLRDAGVQPGQTVLEVGCGTGFFTLPAATLIGDKGRLIAMDVTSDFITRVSIKVEAANLKNVQVIKRNALDTDLDTASIDTVLLFGVLPFPLLPLNQLLPEMHRVLKPEGSLSVWLWPAFLGPKVDPSVRVIHVHQQTKWRLQLQAMLRRKVRRTFDFIGFRDGVSNPHCRIALSYPTFLLSTFFLKRNYR